MTTSSSSPHPCGCTSTTASTLSSLTGTVEEILAIARRLDAGLAGLRNDANIQDTLKSMGGELAKIPPTSRKLAHELTQAQVTETPTVSPVSPMDRQPRRSQYSGQSQSDGKADLLWRAGTAESALHLVERPKDRDYPHLASKSSLDLFLSSDPDTRLPFGNGSGPRADTYHPTKASRDVMEAMCSAERRSRLSHDTAMNSIPTLSPGWPSELNLRAAIRHQPRDIWSSCVEATATNWQSQTQTTRDSALTNITLTGEAYWEKLIMTPESTKRRVLDVFLLLLLFYEAFAIPFQLAWVDDVRDLWVRASVLITAILFKIDMGLTFFTGFYRNGELLMSPMEIARNYFIGWFALDMLSLVCDIVTIIMMYVVTEADGPWIFLRLSALARGILKMPKAWTAISERMLSEKHQLAIRCFRVMTNLLVFNHWLSCAWFALGRSSISDTGLHWVNHWDPYPDINVDELPGDKAQELDLANHFLHLSKTYQYLTVYQHSLSQMVGGSTFQRVYTTYERGLCILGLMAGMLLCSAVISALSAALIELEMQQWETSKKLQTVSQYLLKNAVSRAVAIGVKKEVAERLRYKERLQESDVMALQLLSLPTRTRLRFELFSRHLELHPLFRLWIHLDRTMVEQFCVEAIDDLILMPQDELFRAGQPRDETYILTKGTVDYTQHPSTSLVAEQKDSQAHVGDWLCEAALWIEWTSVGTATAAGQSQAFTLKADHVVQSLRRRHIMASLAAEYAIHFHRAITCCVPPHSEYPSDLKVPFTDYADIVTTMRPEFQVEIGRQALDLLTNQWRWGTVNATVSQLEDEVRSGRCTLLVEGDGEPRRVTSVCALRVEDGNGQMLMQIFKMEGTTAKPSFQMPGGKQERGEMVIDTLDRLLLTKLKSLKDRLDFDHAEREVYSSMSLMHLVKTKYIKTVLYARLQGSERLDQAIMMHPVHPHMHSSKDDSSLCQTEPRDVRYREPSAGDSVDFADLADIEVFQFEDDPRHICYAWIPEDYYRFLSSPAGEPLLHKWVSLYDVEGRVAKATPSSSSFGRRWGGGFYSTNSTVSRQSSSAATLESRWSRSQSWVVEAASAHQDGGHRARKSIADVLAHRASIRAVHEESKLEAMIEHEPSEEVSDSDEGTFSYV